MFNLLPAVLIKSTRQCSYLVDTVHDKAREYVILWERVARKLLGASGEREQVDAGHWGREYAAEGIVTASIVQKHLGHTHK